jgi:Molecular chaperone GrpE (heat shock protein)
MRDRLMRSLADLENIRKRAEKDRREAAIYGGQKLARDMLSVFDNLNRALSLMDDSLREQQKGLAEGLDLTLRDLGNIFQRHGIERVAPEVGEQFDPHFHEAMFEAPVPGDQGWPDHPGDLGGFPPARTPAAPGTGRRQFDARLKKTAG